MADRSAIETQCVCTRRGMSWQNLVRRTCDYLKISFSLGRQRGRARAAWAARAGRLCRLEALEPRWALSVGDPYSVPTSPGNVINEDPGWKFQLNPSGTPQSVGYNDSAWSSVDLPYTWNGNSSSTGNGWYRKTITVDPSLIGNEFYLNFEAGYLVTNLYIDGVQVDYNPNVVGTDPHNGGFAGFTFDVTNQLTSGSHLLAVQVNNSNNSNISPTGSSGNTGDYTHQGGLYRDVSLIAVGKTHVALIENATDVPPSTSPASIPTNTPISTPGVYFTTTSNVTIGTPSANVQVKTVLDNQSLSATTVDVISYLVDASGVIQSQQTSTQSLSASQTSVAVTQTSTVANPHLWDGRIDPYLYDLYVEVRDDSTNQLLDVNHQRVGIRSFKINAQPNTSDADPTNDAAFMLNGHPYVLVGVDVHQDSGVAGQLGAAVGFAQTDAELQADINMVLDLGATVIRTSHYQDNQALYAYCDQVGLMVYTEMGLQQAVTSTTPNSAFVNSVNDQLTEMIKQNYNHPSIFAWGLFNELGTGNGTLIQNMSNLAHILDPTRYSAAASNQGSATDAINAAPDIVGRHFYDGWYGGVPESMGAELDSYHNGNPTDPMGVTEVGAGASAYQYSTNIQISPPNTTDRMHPANVQSQIVERQWAQLASKKYLWADIVWQMFDAASVGKNEGDTLGVNDKGLVTRDRTTKKDSFYFYQANWNDPSRTWANQKVLYISDHAWADRTSPAVTVTTYSNLGAPTLSLNGTSLGTMAPLVISGVTIPNAYAMNVTLATGNNSVLVSRQYNSQTYTDSVVWAYHAASLAGTALARIDFTNSAGSLQSGYAADTGQAYGIQGGNGTYGWVNSSTQAATANSAGTYNRTTSTTAPFDQIDARTGIMLPTNRNWEFALPNGVYDVHVVAADSTNPAMVNNLTLEGFQLHDIDYSTDFTLKDNGFDEYYARVAVADGRLTLAAGPGSVSPRLAYIDINSFTPPALPGDYNGNGVVDAADYVVWRGSLGANVATPYTGADGNGNGVVDQPDFGIWVAQFGATSPGSGAAASALSIRTGTGINTMSPGSLSDALTGVYASSSIELLPEFSAPRQFGLLSKQPFDPPTVRETLNDLLDGRIAVPETRSSSYMSLRKAAATEAADSVFGTVFADEYHDNDPLCQSLAREIVAGVAMDSRLL
jgi:beta-galactosidase